MQLPQYGDRDVSMESLSLFHRLELSALGDSRFIAAPAKIYAHRVFGGHTLAQACLAASYNDQKSTLNSFKAHFLSAGHVDTPIEYRVQPLREGRSFSVRNVEAYQDDRLLLSWQGMFTTETSGTQAQQVARPDVPIPESLPTLAQLRANDEKSVDGFKWPPGHDWARHSRPFDVRYVGSPDGEPQTRCYWLKSEPVFQKSQNVQRALLAFASDHSLATSVSHSRGDLAAGNNRALASLDHDLWFHRDVQAGEWYLYVQRSPFSTDRLGLAQASFYNEEGELVASVAQQVLRSAATS